MLFKKPGLKVAARAKSRVSPSHISHIVIHGDSRNSERLDKMRLDGISISESKLINCVFADVHSGSVALGGGHKQSTYQDCIFEECDFRFFAVGNVRLERCQFVRCRLSNMLAPNLESIGCSFPGTTIRNAVFNGSTRQVAPGYPERKRNEFRDNDFSTTEFDDVGFRGGIDLTQQKLPATEGYLLIADTCRAGETAKRLIGSLTDPTAKKRVQLLVGLLEFNCSMGQVTQLLDIRGWGEFGNVFQQEIAHLSKPSPQYI